MRTQWIVMAALAVLAVPGAVRADETPLRDTPGHITVTGEGRVELRPDLAVMTLGVVTEAATAAEALAANSAQAAAVLDRLRARGIAEADLQTSGLTLNPVYDERGETTPEGGPRVRGYQAQNMVRVRLRDLAAVGGTIDATVGAGANSLYGLSFGLADPVPALDQARAAAVADARRKAELYAAAAGVRLGPVRSLSEQPGYGMPMAEMADASYAKAAVPVAAGAIEITATVTVLYDLAP